MTVGTEVEWLKAFRLKFLTFIFLSMYRGPIGLEREVNGLK